MSIKINDEKIASQFSGTNVPQEVIGPTGLKLGQFIPVGGNATIFPELGISDEELFRILNDPNEVWRTPEEVMARLREIDKCTP
jgi:hypothetical protein